MDSNIGNSGNGNNNSKVLDVYGVIRDYITHEDSLINSSGWWIIVPIVNLIFLIGEGTKGDNKFGLDPWGGGSQY